MLSDIMTKEEAKNIAVERIKLYNRPPMLWSNELQKIQSEYWKIHGFNLTKDELIKKQKELIEIVELESMIIIRYNPNIESQKMILKELENLEEKDLI